MDELFSLISLHSLSVVGFSLSLSFQHFFLSLFHLFMFTLHVFTSLLVFSTFAYFYLSLLHVFTTLYHFLSSVYFHYLFVLFKFVPFSFCCRIFHLFVLPLFLSFPLLFLSLSVVASPASSLHFTSMNRCPLGRLIELHWNTFGDKCQSLHHHTCSIFRVGPNNQQSFRVDKPKGKYFLQYFAQTFAALHLRNPLHEN